MKDSEDRRAILPPELRPLFDAAWHELVLVHVKWHVTKQLFSGGEARAALLNRTGSAGDEHRA